MKWGWADLEPKYSADGAGQQGQALSTVTA